MVIVLFLSASEVENFARGQDEILLSQLRFAALAVFLAYSLKAHQGEFAKQIFEFLGHSISFRTIGAGRWVPLWAEMITQ